MFLTFLSSRYYKFLFHICNAYKKDANLKKDLEKVFRKWDNIHCEVKNCTLLSLKDNKNVNITFYRYMYYIHKNVSLH